MKVNVFLTLLSIALSALIGYLAFNVADGKENDVICGIGSTICFLATLIPTIGLQYDTSRLGVNLRIFSALCFLVFLISHFCFARFGVTMPYYVICNGIILIIYLVVFYKMQGINKV